MTVRDPDDAHVNYTVKELLAGIKTDQAAGFARIETSMSGKADKADVARMEARLDSHGERLGALEQKDRDRQYWKKIGAGVVGLLTSVGVILGGLGAIGIIHFH